MLAAERTPPSLGCVRRRMIKKTTNRTRHMVAKPPNIAPTMAPVRSASEGSAAVMAVGAALLWERVAIAGSGAMLDTRYSYLVLTGTALVGAAWQLARLGSGTNEAR